MRWYFTLSRKFTTNKQKSFSKIISRLATINVALSIAIMLLSIAIISEFQFQIKQKVTNLTGNVLIEHVKNVNGSEKVPLTLENKQEMDSLYNLKSIKNLFPILQKPAILRTPTDIQGIIVNAIDKKVDASHLQNFILKGKNFDFKQNEFVWIGNELANLLNLKIGDRLKILFLVNNANGNAAKAIYPKVAGLFSTGAVAFDKNNIFVSLPMLKRVVDSTFLFTSALVFAKPNITNDVLMQQISEKLNPEVFKVNTAEQNNNDIFEWLKILDTNVWLIISIMILVSAIAMSTTLLIIITEKASTIGLLKSMGAKNTDLQKLFLIQVARIAVIGIVFGNVLAFVLGYLQQTFKFIKLNPENYYLNYVVLKFDLLSVCLINAGSFILIFATLVIPVLIVSKINPIKTIKFN